jgi:ubiquitin C-terminal hydrolase
MKFCKILLLIPMLIFSGLCTVNKGLEWADNSCYFDSSIQLLSHIDEFNEDLKNYEPENTPPTSVYIKLVNLIRNKWKKGNTYLERSQKIESEIDLQTFHLSFSKEIDKKSGEKGQKDANEFIRYLMNNIMVSIEGLKQALFTRYKNEALKILSEEYFANESAAGQISAKKLLDPFARLRLMASDHKICNSCKNEWTLLSEPDFITDLPISEGDNLLDCLSRYFGNEKLDDYKCDRCGNIGRVVKSLRISSLPDYLILSMRRGGKDAMGRTTKLTTPIIFGPEIDLNKNAHWLTEDLKNKIKAMQVKYKLQAFIVHGGDTFNSGHYWAYGNDGTEWCLYNDQYVYPTRTFIENIFKTGLDNNNLTVNYVNATPYILLYKKFETKLEPKPQPAQDPLKIKLDKLKNKLGDMSKSLSDPKIGILNRLNTLKSKLTK